MCTVRALLGLDEEFVCPGKLGEGGGVPSFSLIFLCALPLKPQHGIRRFELFS